MKKALVLLMLLGVSSLAGAALLDTATFYPNRDTFLNGGDAYDNQGARTAGRMGKSGVDESLLADWDTQAISDWLAVPGRIPGGAYAQFQYLVKVSGGVGVTTLSLYSFDLDQDWAEGNATTRFNDFNWTIGTKAATREYAQCAYIDADGDPLTTADRSVDAANSVAWTQDDGIVSGDFHRDSDLRRMTNAATIDTTGVLVNTYISFLVDNDADPANLNLMIDRLLNNADNRGLIIGGSTGLNIEGYSTNSGGTANDPYLLVTIVPEPASMTLLVLGGLGVLLRRKR